MKYKVGDILKSYETPRWIVEITKIKSGIYWYKSVNPKVKFEAHWDCPALDDNKDIRKLTKLERALR